MPPPPFLETRQVTVPISLRPDNIRRGVTFLSLLDRRRLSHFRVCVFSVLLSLSFGVENLGTCEDIRPLYSII